MGEAAPELVLVQARLILAGPGLVARCGLAVGRVTTPPCGGLGRFELIQPLPFLGGDQYDGTVAGAEQGHRAVASLDLVGDCLQIVRIADWLLFHVTSMARRGPAARTVRNWGHSPVPGPWP